MLRAVRLLGSTWINVSESGKAAQLALDPDVSERSDAAKSCSTMTQGAVEIANCRGSTWKEAVRPLESAWIHAQSSDRTAFAKSSGLVGAVRPPYEAQSPSGGGISGAESGASSTVVEVVGAVFACVFVRFAYSDGTSLAVSPSRHRR